MAHSGEVHQNGQGWNENLPKPSVPSLTTTMERYLAGLEPVIPSQQFERTKLTTRCFMEKGSDGEQLQKLLLEYAERTDNWVTDFWLDDMYLCNPAPLLVNSNPFFLLPRQTFKLTSEQINFAAAMVHFALEFREKINRQTLSQDVGKGQKRDQQLCMQTYRHFFTACRIPGESKDELQISTNSNHFVVAAFNKFHVVYLEPDKIPSCDDLCRCLYSIWNDAKSKRNNPKLANVGILTTEQRKVWAKIRHDMLKDESNKESLKLIESSLFVLCLDDFVTPPVPTKSGYRNSIQIAKMDHSYMASMLLHGGGSNLHTPNRWFDKFLQIVVSKEGICGLLVEHSASEGVTVIRFLEQFLEYYHQKGSRLNRQNSVEMQNSNSESTLTFKRLFWNITATLEEQIKESEKSADKLLFDLDLYVLRFADYGHQFIKQQKISPDVFIQLALQLTYYKLHRCLVSTYESCSLRQFRKGRVDNLRSVSMEALAWIRGMCGETDPTTDQEKIDLFRAAVGKQTEILKYTVAGFGADNHLVALRQLAKEHLPNLPMLFREKSFKEFLNFRLSTSQISTNEDILVGYGPVVHDGYGCSYMPKNNLIYFCISSFYSADETSADFFAFSLEGSLLQMRELCHKISQSQNEQITTTGSNNPTN